MRKKLLTIILVLLLIATIFVGLQSTAYSAEVAPTYKVQARETLSDFNKGLYDQLLDKILALKSTDSEQSTVFVLDPTNLGGAKYKWSGADKGALEVGMTIEKAFTNQFDVKATLSALMCDLPLELYWYDKTGTGGSFTSTASNDGETITSFKVGMKVTPSHRGTNYTESKPSVKGVKTTCDTVYQSAMEYVTKWEGKSDYAKIKGYVQDVCSLVEYNSEVNSGTQYSDVWQVTYVFDNDPTTKVVCEGYAKAFQLLCNLSNFSDTTCYTISGSTGGGHMWNVVNIEGNNYLVDATNSDIGAVGQDGQLVLKAPISGSYNSGYTFDTSGSSDISYTYYEDTKATWGESVLTLATSDYVAPAIQFTLQTNTDGQFIYDREEITVGDALSDDVYYTIDNGNAAEYTWSYKIYKDVDGVMDTKQEVVAKDAGRYWVKVIATSIVDGTPYSSILKIDILPKPLTISTVQIQDKSYDGSSAVTPTSITLNGVIDGDVVQADLANSTFLLSSANAGQYNSVYVQNLILVGEDASNYSSSYTSPSSIETDGTVTIQKAQITDYTPTFDYVVATTTFSDLEFSINCALNGNAQNGVIYWYVDDTLITDYTTVIQQDVNYTWVMVFDDDNIANLSGTVKLYPLETVYTVTINADTQKGTVDYGGRQNYIEGETVTLTATPKEGYLFDCWVIGGETVSTNNEYSFTIQNNVTVEARFKSTSTAGETGEGGTIMTILNVLKTIVPYLPYIIIGIAVIGLTILILLYVKISKSAKRKKSAKKNDKK